MGPHQPPLPKRRAIRLKDVELGPQGWMMPETLEGALRSLYRSYEENYARYEATWRHRGAAASAHRGLPEHGRFQADVRLDRRPRGGVARRAPPLVPGTSPCSATWKMGLGARDSARS